MAEQLTEQELQALIVPLLDLCRVAGESICEHYHAADAGDYESKDDQSPLTRADLASHVLLQAGLVAVDATIPILSEESAPADIAQRHQWARYWLIDPLDGTREFLARTGDFSINIALIDNHRPVLGMLYLPLEKEAYLGIPGVQAQLYSECGKGAWSDRPLATRALQPANELVVLSSRWHQGARYQTCMTWLSEQWGQVSRQNMGGALKFCRLAMGQGDFYPRFSPCCEWDTAAGQAVVEAAGGIVLGLDGDPLRYNCRDSLYSPHFYALGDRSHPLWAQLLQAEYIGQKG